MNIGKLINSDELIILLKDNYSFRPIKNDEASNIYRSVIDWPRIKHLRCQLLLCSTDILVEKIIIRNIVTFIFIIRDKDISIKHFVRIIIYNTFFNVTRKII